MGYIYNQDLLDIGFTKKEARVGTTERSHATGKWCIAGVPHKGWTCVSIYDAGEDFPVCEMCEAVSIRWVHVMWHPDHPKLECGCVCAGHMEEDLKGARDREKTAKAAAKDAELIREVKANVGNMAWTLTTTVYTNDDGDDIRREILLLEIAGFELSVWERSGRWWARCKHHRPYLAHTSRKTFGTEGQAQDAAINEMLRLLKTKPW